MPDAPLWEFADVVQRRLIDEVREAGLALQALDMKADTSVRALGCDDSLLPHLRALLKDSRTRLQRIATDLYKEEIGVLPEPDEEYLARITQVFRPDVT